MGVKREYDLIHLFRLYSYSSFCVLCFLFHSPLALFSLFTSFSLELPLSSLPSLSLSLSLCIYSSLFICHSFSYSPFNLLYKKRLTSSIRTTTMLHKTTTRL